MTGYFSSLFYNSAAKEGVTCVTSVTENRQANVDKGLPVIQFSSEEQAERVTDVTKTCPTNGIGYTYRVVNQRCNSGGVTNEASTVKASSVQVTPVTQLHSENTHILLQVEERAAFIEHEGNIPHAWAEAFAYMECMQQPASIPPTRWQSIIHNTGFLLDRHVHDLVKHSWTVWDVFSVHPTCPERRYREMGLLYLLGDVAIYEITAEYIKIITPIGSIQSYRKPTHKHTGQILIWELAHMEGK